MHLAHQEKPFVFSTALSALMTIASEGFDGWRERRACQNARDNVPFSLSLRAITCGLTTLRISCMR